MDVTPQALPRVASLAVDGELVLLDALTRATHVLDPVASVIWPFLDGQTAVADLVDDLATEFSVDRALVATDVHRLIESLDAAGLLVPDGAADIDGLTIQEKPEGPRFVDDPRTPCMEKLDALTWAAQTTFALPDGLHLGVRSTAAEIDLVLRTALARYVADGVDAPANYSIVVGNAANGSPSVHTLYRAWIAKTRARSIRRVLRAAIGALDDNWRSTDGDLLAIEAASVVGPAGAALAPGFLRDDLVKYEGSLRAAGLRTSDHHVALVDPATTELVIPEPRLEVDWDAIDSVADPAADSDPGVAPGRYPLRAIGLLEQSMRSESVAFAQLAGQVSGPRDAALVLARLRTLMSATGLHTLPADHRSAAEELARATRGT
jgi:hypothetical protein